MIKLLVIGSLGKDATVNNVNGKNVINFSVAHSEKYKDKDGNAASKTIWVECAKWGEKTGIAPYLKKGTKVYVEGNPDIKTYQKQDGTTASNITLNVIAIDLIGASNDNAAVAQGQPQQVVQQVMPIKEDGLPF